MQIGEEGHKAFTYTCMTFLRRYKRNYSKIYLAKVKKCFFECFSQFVGGLWQQSWHLRDLKPLNPFTENVFKELCSFFCYFAASITCIMPDLLQEVAELGSKFCPVGESWSLMLLDCTLFLYRAMDWIFRITIHWWRKSAFLCRILPFLQSFGRFSQNVSKARWRW